MSQFFQHLFRPRITLNRVQCIHIIGLTFVLGGELLHLWRQGLVKALLAADERLADGVVVVTHHAGVAAHLVNEGLQGNPGVAALPLAGAVLARLHSVRDTHGVGGPRGAGGMGSGTQAWRARGARGQLRAHAAAGRGRSQHAERWDDQERRERWERSLILPPRGEGERSQFRF